MRDCKGRAGLAAVKIGAALGVAGALLIGVSISPAAAAIGGTLGLTWPSRAGVGSTFTASITISVNPSTSSSDSENVQLLSVFLIPSCRVTSGGSVCEPAANQDPGVFAVLGAVGDARGTTPCANVPFTVGSPSSGSGEVQLTPTRHVIFGQGGPASGRTCQVNVTLLVLKHPSKPAFPPPDGATDVISSVTLQGTTSQTFGFPSATTQIQILDSTPPDTTIISGPGEIAAGRSASFTWTGSDDVTPTPSLVYAFRLHPIETGFSAFGPATSKTYSGLADGTYTFFVKARDGDGIEAAPPDSRTFVVKPGAAIVSSRTGNVTIRSQGDVSTPESGFLLLKGMALETGGSGQVQGACGDGTHFTLNVNSGLFLAESLCDIDGANTVVDLIKGQLTFSAGPVSPAPTSALAATPVLERDVRTPVSKISIAPGGAEFSTTYGQSGKVGTAITTVTSGSVEVTDLTAGTVTVLAAGQQKTVTAEVPTVVASVLPSSRSVEVGATATAFATMINAGKIDAIVCQPTLLSSLLGTFSFQTTDPGTNQPTGAHDTPVSIPAGGHQTFVFGITPTVPISLGEVQLSFACGGTSATIIPGVNTLLLSASETPVPDIVALAATSGATPGTVTIPGSVGSGVFVVATVNVGAAGSITASADSGGFSLPITISLCQTDPSTSACLAPPSSSVTTSAGAGATSTYGIFLTGGGTVPFDPATNRIFVRFRDAANLVRGSTSVAVTTQ